MALPYMERYRKLAPDAQSKWAMPLYTIYLNKAVTAVLDKGSEIIRLAKEERKKYNNG